MTLGKWSSSDEEVFLNFLIFRKRETKGHYYMLTQEMGKSDREPFFKSVTLLSVKILFLSLTLERTKNIVFWCFQRVWKITGRNAGLWGKEGRDGASPPPFPGAKFFSHVKSETIKLLQMKNIWVLSLFIEQDISDKKQVAFSGFDVLVVNWAISYQQWVCKIMFLTRTFVKTNSN